MNERNLLSLLAHEIEEQENNAQKDQLKAMSDNRLQQDDIERLTYLAYDDAQLKKAIEFSKPLSLEQKGSIADAIMKENFPNKVQLASDVKREQQIKDALLGLANAPVKSLNWLEKITRIFSGRVLIGLTAVAATLMLTLYSPIISEKHYIVPQYNVSLSGNIKEFRSSDSGVELSGNDVSEFYQNDEIQLNLRPETAIKGPIEVNLYFKFNNKLFVLPTKQKQSVSGSFLITVSQLNRIPYADQVGELYTVVGKKGQLPARSLLENYNNDTMSNKDENWQLFKHEVIFRSERL